ncbi:MAG: hypothetical protein M1814_006182 [Vezdaea aestivalis]|nr:MAG: hypothetical protein M1814_006182 [Vezdaea aestivalis]
MGMGKKQYSIAQRAQALTLLEIKPVAEVMTRTGMGRQTLYDLKRKAIERGYDANKPLLDEYVVDAPRSGRPKNSEAVPLQVRVSDNKFRSPIRASAEFNYFKNAQQQVVQQQIVMENPQIELVAPPAEWVAATLGTN